MVPSTTMLYDLASTVVPGETVSVAPLATVTFPVEQHHLTMWCSRKPCCQRPSPWGEPKQAEARKPSRKRTLVAWYGVGVASYQPRGYATDKVYTHPRKWWARPDLNRGLTAPSRQV